MHEAVADLFWEFDPAVLADARDEIPTEYDALIAGVIALSKDDATGVSAATWLVQTLRADWGIAVAFEEARELGVRAHAVASAYVAGAEGERPGLAPNF